MIQLSLLETPLILKRWCQWSTFTKPLRIFWDVGTKKKGWKTNFLLVHFLLASMMHSNGNVSSFWLAVDKCTEATFLAIKCHSTKRVNRILRPHRIYIQYQYIHNCRDPPQRTAREHVIYKMAICRLICRLAFVFVATWTMSCGRFATARSIGRTLHWRGCMNDWLVMTHRPAKYSTATIASKISRKTESTGNWDDVRECRQWNHIRSRGQSVVNVPRSKRLIRFQAAL